MDIIVIQDIPPSNNKFLGQRGKGKNFEYSKEKKKWEFLITSATIGMYSVPLKKATVILTYHFPDNRRRDPDNYSGKFILDGLVRAGVLEDDSFDNITLQLCQGAPSKKNPRVEITIKGDE